MRSAYSSKEYLFVNYDKADSDKRIYSKLKYDPVTGKSEKEHVSINNIRMINGEIWGIIGKSSYGTGNTLVKPAPFKGGMKAAEAKNYKGYCWK